MDCFSSHVVPNPDLESEIMLLRSYAPSVDEALLRRVSASFGELRMMFEQGDISYPYSTREAVAVSRHLEKYPNDDVVAVLHNVLDLDSFTDQYVTLGEVFGRHGFPFETYETFKRAIGHSRDGVQLQIEYKTDRSSEGSNTPPPVSSPKIGMYIFSIFHLRYVAHPFLPFKVKTATISNASACRFSWFDPQSLQTLTLLLLCAARQMG